MAKDASASFGGLQLEEMWRYAMAGAAFVFVLAFTLDWEGAFLTDRGPTLLLGAGVAALVLGSLIYAVFRSLLQPAIFRLNLRCAVHAVCVPERRSDYMAMIRRTSFGGDGSLVRALMDARWTGRKEGVTPWAELREWGAMIHLLYCSALAILLALFVAFTLSWERGDPPDGFAAVLSLGTSLILCWAAVWSSCRYLQVELRALLRRRHPDDLFQEGDWPEMAH